MSDKNLFEFVKGMLKGGPTGPAQPPAPRRTGPYRYEAPSREQDPDAHNPATIMRIGRSNDGRELVMTLGFGTFLVDREAPTICYYTQGAVSDVPTVELENLRDGLLDKRNVGAHALNYVDLLNVVSHELEARKTRRGAPTPVVAPRQGPRSRQAPQASPDDATNPATIVRVGRSRDGADLVMTLGLGTFVVHRDVPNIRYFDRGREWDVPDMELQLLVDSLMAKQDMREHRYAYIDLLNVAAFVFERRREVGHPG